MTDHRFNADLSLTINGATVECPAKVLFSHYAGYAGNWTDPPEAAIVELTDVIITLPGREPCKLGPSALLDALNDALQEDMFEAVDAAREDAAERRAEARRDDLMMERIA